MDFLHSLLLAGHFIGLALLVGTFFVQMRAKAGHNFTLLLIGGALQLVTGVSLYGLAMANDADVNHMKLGIKGVIALVVFVAALVGFLRQRSMRAEIPHARVIYIEPDLYLHRPEIAPSTDHIVIQSGN